MARCGGAIMGAPTKIQKALGIEDSADALFDWIMTCTDGTCSKDIARAYADVAGPNVDWLDALAEEYLGQPCFEVAMAEANVGTADGGHNGAVGGCLDATGCEYEKFGVKLEEAVPRTHWAKAAPDNTANSGPELFDPLLACIEKQSNIEAVFNTALVKLVTNAEGVVIGVEAEGAGGREFYKASKGVMLATGGFPAGLEMQERFCQDALDYSTYMCKDCTGDGVKAAMAVGADLYNMCNYYPIEVAQQYHYNVQYNDVYNSWDMDSDGYMEVPAMNMAETHGGLVINTAFVLLRLRYRFEHLRHSGQLSWMRMLRKLLVCVRPHRRQTYGRFGSRRLGTSLPCGIPPRRTVGFLKGKGLQFELPPISWTRK